MAYKLSKRNIFRKNKEFQTVYRYGKSYANRYMVLYVLPGKEARARVGFAAGKRLGCAVVRNRVKRILREVYRLSGNRLRLGPDLLLVGRKPMVGLKRQDAEKHFEDLCRKAQIWKQ